MELRAFEAEVYGQIQTEKSLIETERSTFIEQQFQTIESLLSLGRRDEAKAEVVRLSQVLLVNEEDHAARLNRIKIMMENQT